jgi:hypothetical protein
MPVKRAAQLIDLKRSPPRRSLAAGSESTRKEAQHDVKEPSILLKRTMLGWFERRVVANPSGGSRRTRR